MARDPAMLIYLDSIENRKREPNENFAREVMELFCLGLDQYTQQDVHQLARCFTGMEVRRRQYRFNTYEHDEGEKTVLGKTANFNIDSAIEHLLDQPATARFIARKLVRWFITDDPLEDALLDPLAKQLHDSRYDIRATVRTLLGSRLMFSEYAMANQVRSPVSLVIGWMRSCDITCEMQTLIGPLREMGQLPLYPPNVAGWPGAATWINSQTLVARSRWAWDLTHRGDTKYLGGDLNTFANKCGGTAAQRLQTCEDLLLAVPLSENQRSEILAAINQDNAAEQMRVILSSLIMTPQAQIA